MAFAEGQMVGPYRIMEQLGQGGMATVYKAYHPALDRYVAIKVLHAAFREDPTFLARFTREARLVAKLEHPNIVPIYDYSECDGQPYLVMKFIEGQTLKAVLATRSLSAPEAVRIVQAIGAALSYAHSKGILHRDIKPSNVLITPEGNIFLADFGLARIAQSGESTLSSDMLLGTPHYISPEQAQGLKDLNEGTDIYSLGVVLYELSVGRVPFNADTPFSIIHDHIFTPLPIPHLVNPKVPPGVERVLLKALAKDRNDRYPDVASMVQAFTAAVDEVVADRNAPADTLSKIQTQSTKPLAPRATAKAPPAVASATKPPFWKRIPAWLLIVLAVFACGCVCLLTLGTLSSANQTRQTQTAAAAGLLPTVEQVLTGEPVTPVLQENVPADSQSAWNLLLSGLTFLQNGDPASAQTAFQNALDAIPPERVAVYVLAIRRLAGQNQWLTAAGFCQRGLLAHPDEPTLRNACTEVIFRAAEDPAAGEPLNLINQGVEGWSITEASYGRWLGLHAANPQEAAPHLQRAVDLAHGTEILVANAVTGEYECITGNTAQGVRRLNGILADPNLPPWLKGEIERMLAKWQ